jgi:hypothetical protein
MFAIHQNTTFPWNVYHDYSCLVIAFNQYLIWQEKRHVIMRQILPAMFKITSNQLIKI